MPSSKRGDCNYVIQIQETETKNPYWKNLHNNSENLDQMKFVGNLSILGSMYHEDHLLAYTCRQLKNAGKSHSTWFWNNVINVKLNERCQPAMIYHIIDIKIHLGVDNLNEFINNISF